MVKQNSIITFAITILIIGIVVAIGASIFEGYKDAVQIIMKLVE